METKAAELRVRLRQRLSDSLKDSDAEICQEIDQLLRSAVERNPDIRYIFRCLDYKWILMPARDMFYDPAQFPTYLYDNDPFNDVQYIMNKDVLLEATDKVIADTYRGGEPFNFDTYCRWHQWATFGKEAISMA